MLGDNLRYFLLADRLNRIAKQSDDHSPCLCLAFISLQYQHPCLVFVKNPRARGAFNIGNRPLLVNAARYDTVAGLLRDDFRQLAIGQ
jgi:hypothetical protein